MKKNPAAETKTVIFPPYLRHQPIHAVGSRNRRRSRDGRIMKTSQAELMATPQFDSGRWKLRLERVPPSTVKQFNGPVVSWIVRAAPKAVSNEISCFVKCRSSEA